MPMSVEDQEFTISIDVEVERMGWPDEGPVAHGVGNNRSYEDLTHTRWSDVDTVIEEEIRLLDRVALAGDEDREDALESAQEEFTAPEALGVILDLGVASATLALNAAGCPTITACNGHVTGYPYVAFWARKNRVELLSRLAREAGIGFGNADLGALEVYAPPKALRAMVAFAKIVRHASTEFRAIRSDRPRPTRPARPRTVAQLNLPFGEDAQ